MLTRTPFRFGKKPFKRHPHTLRLSKYLSRSQLSFKIPVEWHTKVTDWGMMLNDTLGDCTCAGVGHAVQGMTAYSGTEVVLPDSVILDTYEKVGGYNPADPNTDQGANMVDVLNYWRTVGVGGHKILAWAQVGLPQADRTEYEASIALFGGTYMGLDFPDDAAMIFGPAPWSVPAGNPPGDPSNGHAIWGNGIGNAGSTAITWGAPKQMDLAFESTYLTELYAVITQDWINQASKKTPSGLDLDQLLADIESLSGPAAPG